MAAARFFDSISQQLRDVDNLESRSTNSGKTRMIETMQFIVSCDILIFRSKPNLRLLLYHLS